MNKPHRWVKEIHAFADGIEIQERNIPENSGWYTSVISPPFNDPDFEFRLKPKEPIGVEICIYYDLKENYTYRTDESANTKFTFDPDTGFLLSVEMVK